MVLNISGARTGPGFGDFLGRGSRGFFLVNTVGAVFPLPDKFFFLNISGASILVRQSVKEVVPALHGYRTISETITEKLMSRFQTNGCCKLSLVT
jgi:hypothetical protein